MEKENNEMYSYKSEFHTLFDILDTLSTAQRICVVMYYYENQDVKEIADELKLNETKIVELIDSGRKQVDYRISEIYKYEYIEAPMLYFVLLIESALKYVFLEKEDSLKLYKRVFGTN